MCVGSGVGVGVGFFTIAWQTSLLPYIVAVYGDPYSSQPASRYKLILLSNLSGAGS